MSKLPADLSGQDLTKALQKTGFVVQRQRGSHVIFAGEIRSHALLRRITRRSAPERFALYCTKPG
jgi:predicted RNA binding protein YcfA (HicA-like mRNA interferase family)